MLVMKYGMPIELLSPGEYEIEKGRFVRFDAHDLARMAIAYDDAKKKRRAPVVIGHPESDNDADARAWVTSLRMEGNALFGIVDDFVSETFLAGLNDKTYARYQPQFWGPEHPDNPKPGAWVLRHVGVLGPPLQDVRGPLVTEAAFAESMGAAGRKLKPELRFSAGGFIEFAEFPIRPVVSQDIAQRARALMCFLAERDEQISWTEAVQAVISLSTFYRGDQMSIDEVAKALKLPFPTASSAPLP